MSNGVSEAAGAVEAAEEDYPYGDVLGHPRGLYVLFLTEMWERFSYYGMRALLILFLTKHFLFSAGEASLIYGAYTGMIYMLPVVGGFLADRYLGSRKAVTYGAILLVIGHMSLAFEGPPATVEGGTVFRSDFHLSIFFFSLALIITGVGFLKANISTIVGTLYKRDDPRRDGGFTIFYMGINIGSFTATLLCGWLGETYGWGYGFGAAGIGMLLGLIVFLWGQPLLAGRADPPDEKKLKEKVFGPIDKEYAIYIFGIVLVVLSWIMIQFQEAVSAILGGSGLVMLAVVVAYGFTKCTKVERDRLFVASFLIVFQVVFWALFEQQGASLTLLADQQFDKTFLGINFKASQIQFMNPLFIVLLAPLYTIMWQGLAKKDLEPSTPVKFGIAMLLVGAGYLFFAFGVGLTDVPGKSFFWLILIYLFMTMAELSLSPIGLSMITKLSVARIVGMMMGMWFLFIAFANNVAGLISALTGSTAEGAAAGALDVGSVINVYSTIGWVSVAVGVFIFVVSPILRKGMHGVH